MSVYVDDAFLPFRNMLVCHMIADTTDELMTMAHTIGVNTKWIQYPDTPREHFDIAKSKRAHAIANGAIAIGMRELACMCRRREVTGLLGDPADAIEWMMKQ